MSFQCLTCGHKGKQTSQGACPACGSFKLKRKSRLKLEPEKSKKNLGLKSLAMTLLWLYLGYLTFQNLLGY